MVGSTTNRISFNVTSASTAPLSVTYRFDDPSWLQVTYVETDSPTIRTLVSGTDYTPGGDGEAIEGTVTLTDGFLESITSGVLVIARFTPALQELDLQYNTRFPSELTEKQFDMIVMALQDRSDSNTQAGTRAIVLPPNEPTANTNTLQVWTERAGKLQYFNADTGAITTISIEDLAPLILAYYDGIITAEDVLAAISAIAPLERFTPPTTSTLGKFGQLAIIPEHVDLEITGTLTPDITGTLLPWKTQNGKIWFSTYGEDPTTLTGDAISVLISWTGAWVISVYEYGVVNVSTRWASFPGSWLSDPYPNNVGSWINIGTTGQPAIDTTNEEAARFWANLAPTDTTPNWQEVNGTSGTITPEMFGAAGDGTTDDTEAIQAAINSAGSQGGGTIVLGPKTYKVSETGTTGYCLLMPYDSVRIIGQGVSSRIACDDATATTILVAKGVGPYDSETEWVDHCEVSDIYLNPLIQKGDDVFEISVPYTRHFTFQKCHYGRFGPLVTGASTTTESRIGSVIKVGDPLAPISSDVVIRDIRGFGHYRAIHNTNCVDTLIDGWLADANRANAQSILISGHSEGIMAANCGIVNSAVATQTATGSNLIIQPDASGTPKYNKFTNFFFDSHRYGATIEGSISTDFVNCWFNGSAGGSLGNGVVIGGALHVRFTNCSFNDTRKGGIVVNSSKFVSFTDCEVLSSNTLEFSGDPSILVNTGAQFTSFKGIRVENTGENSNSSLSMVIEAGASNTTWDDSCFFRNGILDKRNLGGDVPTSGLYHWFRASHNSPLSNADLVSRWTDGAPNPAGRAALVATSEAASPIARAEGYQFSGAQWMALNNDRTDTRFYQSLGDFTLIFLAKVSNDTLFLGGSDGAGIDPNYQVRYFGETTTSPAGTMGIYLNAGSLLESTDEVSDPTGWHLLEYNRSGTSLKFFADGVQLGTSVVASTANLEFNRLGGGFGIGLPEGLLKEVIIYNRSINSTERGQITAYVRRQYFELIP